MVKNRIKVMRAEADISATALAEKLPDVQSKVAMSFIEQGRVLPTRDSLEQMCELLGCTPTDLYRERDLDLLSVGGGEADSEFEVEGFQKPETTRPTDKEGQERMACVAYSFLIDALIKNPERKTLIEALEGAKQLIPYYDYEKLTSSGFKPKPTGYVVDSFEVALHCILTTDLFKAAVIKAVNLGGDADTIGAITGGIAGALYGYSAIPRDWKESLSWDVRKKLDDLSEAAEARRYAQ